MEKSSAKPHFKIESGQVLPGHSSDYAVDQYLGQGSFGTVIRCRKVNSSEVVAVKMLRNNYTEEGKKEAKHLENIRKLDPDRNNLVKFHEHFMYENHLCLVFENLDLSLYHFIKKSKYTPLHLYEIRPIAQQMLVALKALKSINLVHADIKPDNVVLVNHGSQPFKVKLIDFGLATEVPNFWKNDIVQNLGYRAPEVLLKHPDVNEAVDMWTLGSVLAYLYLGNNLYPCDNELQAMKAIMVLNGKPDNDFLDAASKTRCFFNLVKKQHHHEWWLKTVEEYFLERGRYAPYNFFPPLKFDLMEELLAMQKKNTDAYISGDAVEFISLLKEMLEVNPRKRIIPEEALKHNFITMKHFNLYNNDAYIGLSKVTMSVCSYDAGNCISTENTKLHGSYRRSDQKGTKAVKSSTLLLKKEREVHQDTLHISAVKKGTYGARTVTDDQQVPPDVQLSQKVSEGDVKLSKKSSRIPQLLFSRLFRPLHRSGEQKVTSPPVRLTEDEQDSSNTATGKNESNEMNPDKQEVISLSSVTEEQQDRFKRGMEKTESNEAGFHKEGKSALKSETKEKQGTSNMLTVSSETLEDRCGEQKATSPPVTLTEDEQDSSKTVTDRNGLNDHQHEDPEMQLSEEVCEGDVRKKNSRIFQFFSWMFGCLHIHRKKDNINDDTQLRQQHMTKTVTEEQQDTAEILTVDAGTVEDRSSEQEITSAPPSGGSSDASLNINKDT